MEKVIIEEFVETDFEAVLEILTEMWLLQGENTTFLSAELIKNHDSKPYVHSFLNDDNKKMFVAKVQNKVIGTINVEINDGDICHTFKKEAYVGGLSVSKEYRQKGVATMLNQKVEAYVRGKGVNLLTAKIYEFNKPSQNTAIKQGYKKEMSTFIKVLD